MATAERTSLDRLDAALAALEAAASRAALAERSRADVTEALAAMDEDRQRLADALDGALTRAAALEQVNDAVGRRLDQACTQLADLLTGADSA